MATPRGHIHEDIPMDETPLLVRLLSRPPGSRLVWALLWGAVPMLGAFLPHAYIATVGRGSLERSVVVGAAFGFAVVVSVLAVAYITNQLPEIRATLRRLVPDSMEDPFAATASVAGPLVLAGLFVVFTVSRTA